MAATDYLRKPANLLTSTWVSASVIVLGADDFKPLAFQAGLRNCQEALVVVHDQAPPDHLTSVSIAAHGACLLPTGRKPGQQAHQAHRLLGQCGEGLQTTSLARPAGSTSFVAQTPLDTIAAGGRTNCC